MNFPTLFYLLELSTDSCYFVGNYDAFSTLRDYVNTFIEISQECVASDNLSSYICTTSIDDLDYRYLNDELSSIIPYNVNAYDFLLCNSFFKSDELEHVVYYLMFNGKASEYIVLYCICFAIFSNYENYSDVCDKLYSVIDDCSYAQDVSFEQLCGSLACILIGCLNLRPDYFTRLGLGQYSYEVIRTVHHSAISNVDLLCSNS